MTGFSTERDTLKSDAPRPKLAATLSLLPGAGQIYNGKWWKVPIIYAGFVGIAAAYDFHRVGYQESRHYLLWADRATQLNKYTQNGNIALNGPLIQQDISIKKFILTSRTHEEIVDYYSRVPESGIETYMNERRKHMEMLVFGGVIWYLFNIADAAVDAHLKTFDVGDDLTLRWQPTLLIADAAPGQITHGLTFKLELN